MSVRDPSEARRRSIHRITVGTSSPQEVDRGGQLHEAARGSARIREGQLASLLTIHWFRLTPSRSASWARRPWSDVRAWSSTGRSRWLGVVGLVAFVVTETGIASVVGPDAIAFGIDTYATAVVVITVGLTLLSIQMLKRQAGPRWAPLV